MVSTFDERWDNRRKQNPALANGNAGTANASLGRLAVELQGSYALAGNLKASAVLTLVLGLFGALVIGSEAGFGAGLLAASSALFVFFLIRWLEKVLLLLAGISLKLHGLEAAEQ